LMELNNMPAIDLERAQDRAYGSAHI
jgi:hypothetical protein